MVRITLKNFMTYKNESIFPGETLTPHLIDVLKDKNIYNPISFGFIFVANDPQNVRSIWICLPGKL